MSYHYHVQDLVKVASDLVRVWLAPAEGSLPLRYRAGQYLMLQPFHQQQPASPFSIANAPNSAGIIELHMRHVPSDPQAENLCAALSARQDMLINGPLGKTWVLPSAKEVLLVAGGTGISYSKAILEEAMRHFDKRQYRLLWFVKDSCDFYLEEFLETCRNTLPKFSVNQVVTRTTTVGNFTYGLLKETIETVSFAIEEDTQAYLSGPFGFVLAVKEGLVARGISANVIFSDMLLSE